MSVNQLDKARLFQALHQRSGTFVMPNAWDAGSARVLAGLGFAAIATSSGACAGSLGRLDGKISREEALTHIRAIAPNIDIPLAGDLENGFGDSPEHVMATIRLAAEAGLVGGSIEDAGGTPHHSIYDRSFAIERVTAAVEAARALPFPFTLTARCENFLRGNPNLDDTIQRLQAFADAGADVLFAPALPDLAAVRTVCQAVTKPVSFMAGIKGHSFTVSELAAAGVKRVSLATALYRAAMTGLVEAALEIKNSGTFGFLDRLRPGAELNGFMQ
jgi:2-methylisocitrate lyase-like PEP mutase family enzyme